MAVPHLYLDSPTEPGRILITGYERYQITTALAAFAFLAHHTEALLPSAIDSIKCIGEPSRRLHGSQHPDFT